jgi:hypothetical protein
MPDKMTITPGERHVLRVFALDITPEAADRLRNRPDTDDPLARVDPSLRHADRAAVAALFGLDDIDPAQVELVETADLGDLGLAAYLIEGDAAAEAQIAADRARLDGLRGLVVTVPSAAFDLRPVTLRPAPQMTLIGTYAEDVPPVRFDPLPDASARGAVSAPQAASAPGPRRRAGLLAGMALLAAMVLVVLVLLLRGSR